MDRTNSKARSRRSPRGALAGSFLTSIGLALAIASPTSPPSAAELAFSSHLGGTGADQVADLAVAADGSVVVVGTSSSPDLYGAFTRLGCEGSAACGESDVFVLRLSPDGREILSGRFFGGSGHDAATAVTIGRDGMIYVTGTTRSGDFPTFEATQEELGRGATDPSAEQPARDAFIVKLVPDATRHRVLDVSRRSGG